jgi:hypothetical protein
MRETGFWSFVWQLKTNGASDHSYTLDGTEAHAAHAGNVASQHDISEIFVHPEMH